MYGQHGLFPISFTRAVVVIDARGIVRTRKIMLRIFRPADGEVISAIRSAKADALFHTA